MSRQQIVRGLIKGLWKEPRAERWEACGCRGQGAIGCGDGGRGRLGAPSGSFGGFWGLGCYCSLIGRICATFNLKKEALWSQIPGLLPDHRCQIQTDTNPKADTQTCLEKRQAFHIHAGLSLIEIMSHVNQMWFALLMRLRLGGESGPNPSCWPVQQALANQVFQPAVRSISRNSKNLICAWLLFLQKNC